MDNDDIMNSPEIKKLLSELKGKVHIPFELILADAMGRLSTEGHSKVLSHMKTCSECRNIRQYIKEAMDGKESFDGQNGFALNIPIGSVPQPKLKLVATVNSKRNKIAEETAKLFIPENSWFCIKPAITAYRNWLQSSTEADVAKTEELAVAAFTSGISDNRKDFEKVISAVKFADFICDLLVEHCNNLNEIEQKMSESVDDGMAMFDDLKLDEKAKNEILKVLSESLSTDES
jgi:hypothetical protein